MCEQVMFLWRLKDWKCHVTSNIRTVMRKMAWFTASFQQQFSMRAFSVSLSMTWPVSETNTD